MSWEAASQENQEPETGWLGAVRFIPQKLKLGIMDFATGKYITSTFGTVVFYDDFTGQFSAE